MASNIHYCPACGRRLQILKARPGKHVTCPKCGIRFVPPGPSWLEEPVPASKSIHFPHVGKPIWALATVLLLLTGVLGGFFLFGRSANATPAPPVQQSTAAKEASARENARVEFQRLMLDGNAALAGQRFSDAIDSYKDARKLFPEDVDAARGLAAARAGLADSQSAPPTDPYVDALNKNTQVTQKAIVDQQTQRSDYMRSMNQASVALMDGRFDDARNLYVQALDLATDPAGSPVLTLSSGDPYAPPLIQTTPSNASRDSDAALDGLREVNYQKAMADADHAMRTQRYRDAAIAFQAALRQRPNDPDANSGLLQARAYGG
jgi:tetratricopeptide (TPR) repeat protein